MAIAYSRVYGPKHKADPAGHPIILCTGPFDNTEESALGAIMRAAKKHHGIEPHEPAWLLDMAEDVIQPVNASPITYTRVYHFCYLPEQELWGHKGIHGKVKNHFLESHYLTKSHLHTAVDPSVANSLVPKKETPEGAGK